MAETKRQLQVLALQGGTVTNAVDFELALEAVLNALEDVFDHRAGHAPLRTSFLRLGQRRNDDRIVFELEADFVVCDEKQLALRALSSNLLAIDRSRDPSRYLNGLLTDTRHVSILSVRYGDPALS